MRTIKEVTDNTGAVSRQEVTLARDEGNRADTTIDGLVKLAPVRGPGHSVTAGNASQLSDGASACVVMDAARAARMGIEPLGVFRGFVVAGCEPDEMGIGPVFAVPRLLERHGRRSRTSTCSSSTRRSLYRSCIAVIVSAFLPDRLNVNGFAIGGSVIPTA